MEFEPFTKIARLSRECTITEKIDGSNGQIYIRPMTDEPLEFGIDTQIEVDGVPAIIRAGSRSRWLGMTKAEDNFGFGAWVYQNAHELAKLGFGKHFGEWWGSGIQRGYGLAKGEKRFSLFNTFRWSDDTVRPSCCSVVPVLYQGPFATEQVDRLLDLLRVGGSLAALGFMLPEGIIVYHHAAKTFFKKTLEKDDEFKGKAAA
jgi:hypothetical protein